MLWKSRIWKSRGRSAWQRVVTAPAQGQGQMVLLAPDTAKLQKLEMLLVGWITPDLVSSLCAQREGDVKHLHAQSPQTLGQPICCLQHDSVSAV